MPVDWVSDMRRAALFREEANSPTYEQILQENVSVQDG